MVPSYTLYPEATATQQVSEVSEALTWALDHAAAFGGNRQQVSRTLTASYVLK